MLALPQHHCSAAVDLKYRMVCVRVIRVTSLLGKTEEEQEKGPRGKGRGEDGVRASFVCCVRETNKERRSTSTVWPGAYCHHLSRGRTP